LPFVNAFLFLGAKPRFVTAMCRGRIWTNVGGGKKAKDAAKDSAASSLHSVRTGHTCGPPAAKPPPGVQLLAGGGGAAVVAGQDGAGGGQQAGQAQEGLLLLREGLAMPHLTVSEIGVVIFLIFNF
jgi:hypothetical protein